jgi:putative hemolysin
MWLSIFLIITFIFINGFFAATEIAVVTLRKSRIKKLMDDGIKNAVALHKLREAPEKFFATIQIGVTLAVTLASAIGGVIAVETLKPILEGLSLPFISTSSEAIAIAIVASVITYFSIIFGELIPKSIALSHPETVGLLSAPVIEKFSKLAYIFVQVLMFTTNLLLKPFGKKAFRKKSYISEDEIKLLLEEGREKGIFEAEEKELIHSVFDFADIFVKEVMVPSPQMVTIGINMPLDQVKQIILEEQFTRYPVIGKDLNDIRGTLHAKDFFNTLLKTDNIMIRKIVKPPLFAPETMKISFLLREMQKKRVHMAIVIDEYGSVSGLVTLEDLIEEIIGEIRDEFDTESPVIHLKDGSMIIDASINLRDLYDDHNIALPESPDYETLGGFIVASLQRIPEPGDEIQIDGQRLRIIEMVGKRIARVKLEKIEKEILKEKQA